MGLFFFSTFFAVSAWAADCDWYLSQVSGPRTNAEEFHGEYLRGKAPVEQIAKFYEGSAAFKKSYQYLTGFNEFKFDELTDSKKKAVFDAYYEHFMDQFRDPHQLRKLRSKSLKRSLRGHGYKTDPNKTGQQELKELSRANVERILRQLPFWSESEAIANFENVKRRGMNYYRNGRSATSGEFILSSNQLLEYSGRYGENSRRIFNREILQSDDNIFFLVSSNKEFKEKSKDITIYGDRTFQMTSDDYAEAHGMVTPFIMWPGDLKDFALKVAWATGKDLGQADFNGQDYENYTSLAKSWLEKWQARLYQFDFTVSDYQKLIAVLDHYQYFHIEELRKRTLTGASAQEEFRIFSKEAEKFLLSFMELTAALDTMEMRIPVAAPVGIFEELRR